MSDIKMISIPRKEYDQLVAMSGETQCCTECERWAKKAERYRKALEKIASLSCNYESHPYDALCMPQIAKAALGVESVATSEDSTDDVEEAG